MCASTMHLQPFARQMHNWSLSSRQSLLNSDLSGQMNTKGYMIVFHGPYSMASKKPHSHTQMISRYCQRQKLDLRVYYTMAPPRIAFNIMFCTLTMCRMVCIHCGTYLPSGDTGRPTDDIACDRTMKVRKAVWQQFQLRAGNAATCATPKNAS